MKKTLIIKKSIYIILPFSYFSDFCPCLCVMIVPRIPSHLLLVALYIWCHVAVSYFIKLKKKDVHSHVDNGGRQAWRCGCHTTHRKSSCQLWRSSSIIDLKNDGTEMESINWSLSPRTGWYCILSKSYLHVLVWFINYLTHF